MLLCNLRLNCVEFLQIAITQNQSLKYELVTVTQNCVNKLHSSSLMKKHLDSYEKTLEHYIKCKNTRSSRKTRGYKWDQLLYYYTYNGLVCLKDKVCTTWRAGEHNRTLTLLRYHL